MAAGDKDGSGKAPEIDPKIVEEWATAEAKNPDDFDTGTVSQHLDRPESFNPDDFPETDRTGGEADAQAGAGTAQAGAEDQGGDSHLASGDNRVADAGGSGPGGSGPSGEIGGPGGGGSTAGAPDQDGGVGGQMGGAVASQGGSADRDREREAGTGGSQPDKRRWTERAIAEHNAALGGTPPQEPMSDDQREHLRLLSEEAGEPIQGDLGRDEAERKIQELRRRMGHTS
ncbi:MAG TPA: DUF3072 domain-containing protein [Alphaproteobacteria bacterium]|nr:DUF3072 domain-containing protein [Alphaproteobacteria bacterium]